MQWLKDNENNLDMPDEDLTLTLQTSSSQQQQQQEGKKEEQEDESTSTTNEDLKMNKKPGGLEYSKFLLLLCVLTDVWNCIDLVVVVVCRD